jgi:hypothetical protein
LSRLAGKTNESGRIFIHVFGIVNASLSVTCSRNSVVGQPGVILRRRLQTPTLPYRAPAVSIIVNAIGQAAFAVAVTRGDDSRQVQCTRPIGVAG